MLLKSRFPYLYSPKISGLKTAIGLIFGVNRQVIIELKAIDALLPVHKAQLLTYLKLSGSRLGLLINFNVDNLQKGIVRMVH
jgi:GxxExxY protein